MVTALSCAAHRQRECFQVFLEDGVCVGLYRGFQSESRESQVAVFVMVSIPSQVGVSSHV